MTLSEAQIERYSRQILLPEVGGRGQMRLLAARAAIVGSGPAATGAAVLLGRAGVGALELAGVDEGLPELAPECRIERVATPSAAADVVVVTSGRQVTVPARGAPVVVGALDGETLTVTTFVGRPCAACFGPLPAGGEAGVLAGPASLALGALLAGEALRVLLAPPTAGRTSTVSLDTGAVRGTPLPASIGCPRCGERA
jgi:hypothetical protein